MAKTTSDSPRCVLLFEDFGLADHPSASYSIDAIVSSTV